VNTAHWHDSFQGIGRRLQHASDDTAPSCQKSLITDAELRRESLKVKTKKPAIQLVFVLVPGAGIEPAHLAARDFKSHVKLSNSSIYIDIVV
jgi:hypothetical protein